MPTDPADLTSLHVRRAVDGDDESRSWLIQHLSPALHLQASYRLRGALRTYCDPADLVQEVWTVALPKLPQLVARDGRWTPVLVRFLSTTLLHKLNKILKSYLREDRPRREASLGGDSGANAIEGAVGSGTDVVGFVMRNEIYATLHDCIDALEPTDRDLVVLRGVEQLPNKKVAESLGLSESAASKQYRQALQKLRAALPGSVFSELPEHPDGVE